MPMSPTEQLSSEKSQEQSPKTHVNAVEEDRGRLHDRVAVNARLDIYWDDPKNGQRHARVRAADLSKFGMQVESERAIPTGTVVLIYTAQGGVVGRASVRHCVPVGMNYKVGLYLPDRLTRGV